MVGIVKISKRKIISRINSASDDDYIMFSDSDEIQIQKYSKFFFG